MRDRFITAFKALPWVHIAVAVGLMLLVLALPSPWDAVVAGSSPFIAREVTQAEYRLIERFYGGLRANMPVWAAFRERRGWDAKSIGDFVWPAVFCAVLAIVVGAL